MLFFSFRPVNSFLIPGSVGGLINLNIKNWLIKTSLCCVFRVSMIDFLGFITQFYFSKLDDFIIPFHTDCSSDFNSCNCSSLACRFARLCLHLLFFEIKWVVREFGFIKLAVDIDPSGQRHSYEPERSWNERFRGWVKRPTVNPYRISGPIR